MIKVIRNKKVFTYTTLEWYIAWIIVFILGMFTGILIK
jgi:hypothetical protein